eukprot:8945337-Pyramimonas_sp.AAC.1
MDAPASCSASQRREVLSEEGCGLAAFFFCPQLVAVSCYHCALLPRRKKGVGCALGPVESLEIKSDVIWSAHGQRACAPLGSLTSSTHSI